MANVFNSVKGLHPRRNSFSAHTYRNDFNSYLGLNIPVYQQHVTAGSKVKVSTFALARLEALLAPIMDNVDLYVHFWKIPYRLLENDKFTAFISGEIDVEDYDYSLFLTPYEFAQLIIAILSSGGAYHPLAPFPVKNGNDAVAAYNKIIGNGSLLDYLGYDKSLFPDVEYTENTGDFSYGGNENDTTKFNFRPLIAYYLLHEHWYMNENVPYFSSFLDFLNEFKSSLSVDSLVSLLVNTYLQFGYTMLPHGWEKDYFTSALPNVQFGDPVSLPLANNAPIKLNNPVKVHADTLEALGGGYESWTNIGGMTEAANNGTLYTVGTQYVDPQDPSDGRYLDESRSSTVKARITGTIDANDAQSNMFADLSEASAITINELRFANALQVFKERQLRFGRRRLEYYKGFFDVTPEDLRLQVPAYLGGGRIPINISDIEQTSSSVEGQPIGRLAGKGTAVAGGFAGFTTFCSEETILLGIAFVMPHITYANATSRFLLKTNDRYDYFNPSFEHLGEQAIKNIEIYAGSDEPEEEFGYTPRYNEYRFHLNEVHGNFKDNLAYWSLARIFSSTPALNPEFIYMQPANFNRIFAVSNQPNLKCSMIFRQRIIQPVSKYGTPMLMV